MSDDETTVDPTGEEPGTDSPEENEQPDRAGKSSGEEPFDQDRAMAKIRKANSEAAKLRERLKQLEPLAQKAQELEDASKTEAQRLVEARDQFKSRADTAETQLSKLQVALEAAPDGASLAQVKAVAKRVSGSTDEERAADAAELYELLGVTSKPTVKGKPREALRGGGDPDEEPEETDPRKLADRIGR
jgi:hypothetical protein